MACRGILFTHPLPVQILRRRMEMKWSIFTDESKGLNIDINIALLMTKVYGLLSIETNENHGPIMLRGI